jgi:Amt family ammonium transporter
LLKNCIDACIGGIVWFAFGFSAAFGANKPGGFIGFSKYLFCIGLDDEENGNYGSEFLFFQFAFACNAATIVSGSIAERTQIQIYIIFSAFMTGFVYPVVVAWTWGNGWLTAMGFKDFAGSGVVHLTGGISGLVGAIIVGPRLGKFKAIRRDDDV